MGITKFANCGLGVAQDHPGLFSAVAASRRAVHALAKNRKDRLTAVTLTSPEERPPHGGLSHFTRRLN